ncbi:MAG: glycosyltransferase [Rhizobiales bacterium]|nr:glycosyltransferase [Hyphomicrobiales bacterium]
MTIPYLSEDALSFAPELSVIIPTLNERDNLVPLLDLLDKALTGLAWEAIIVDDDSHDGTPELARRLAANRSNLRVIQRIGRGGLASACTEGMMASVAPCFVILDADMQHDAFLIPLMLDVMKEGDTDIVVGSRHVSGGDMGEFAEHRKALSSLGTRLARMLLKVPLSDPMSGFFMVRADFFRAAVHRLSNIGFKILLDLVVSSPTPPRIVELPYIFGERAHGESKLSLRVALNYLELLADKTIGRLIPLRFVIFVMVGMLGVVLHLGALSLLFIRLAIPFYLSQMTATFFAMTVNFVLNNTITYRDRRLTGSAFVWGFLSFIAACGIGAAANFAVADMLFSHSVYWLAAGFLGAIVGSVWNYVVTSTFTWRNKAA